MGRSLGLVLETAAAAGTLEESLVSDNSLVTPSSPKAGETWTHKLAGGGEGSKGHMAWGVHRLGQWSLARTLSENFGDPSDI